MRSRIRLVVLVCVALTLLVEPVLAAPKVSKAPIVRKVSSISPLESEFFVIRLTSNYLSDFPTEGRQRFGDSEVFHIAELIVEWTRQHPDQNPVEMTRFLNGFVQHDLNMHRDTMRGKKVLKRNYKRIVIQKLRDLRTRIRKLIKQTITKLKTI